MAPNIAELLLIVLVAWSSTSITTCQANFLAEPVLRWSLQLSSSDTTSKDNTTSTGGGLAGRGLRRGNGMTVHPGGNRLFVTADDGSLHVVQVDQARPSTSLLFQPTSITPIEGTGGYYVECRSSVTLVEEEAATAAGAGAATEEYLVYAVLDTPILGSNDVIVNQDGIVVPAFDNLDRDGSSRVLAVNLDGSLRWSVQVPGRVQGNPVVGRSGIYVSHNVGGSGSLSVIMVNINNNGEGISAEVVATLVGTDEFGNTDAPLGPPVIQPPLEDDEDSTEDIVLVAENWDEGYNTEQGRLYMLTRTTEFEDTGGRGNESFELGMISTWPFSSTAPPLVVRNSVFLAAAGANLAGFAGLGGIRSGRLDEIDPRWVYQAEPSPRNASQPFLSPPVVDASGDYLVIPGVSNDLYCIQRNNGGEIWVDTEGSQIMAQPQIWESFDQSVVFVIESLSGRVRQHDLFTGERNWDFSCTDIGGLAVCQDAVEAEFAIAPGGNVLYYGDIFGRITSLQIAEFETDAPTLAPTAVATDSPTGSPSTQDLSTEPTIMTEEDNIQGEVGENDFDIPATGNDGEENSSIFDEFDGNTASLDSGGQEEEKSTVNLGLYIGAALGGLCLLAVPLVVFSLMRRGRKDKGEIVVEIIDDCDPTDLESPGSQSTATGASGPSGSDDKNVEVGIARSTTLRSSPGRRGSRGKKKHKRHKSLPGTPQTVLTLDSIEELPEESPNSHNTTISAVVLDEEDGCIEIEGTAINLTKKFASVADSSDESPAPITKGGVGIAPGSDHLELAVGNNHLSPLEAANEGDNLISTSIGDETSDDESPLPPPPASNWSFSSLFQPSSSTTSMKENATDAKVDKKSDSKQVSTSRSSDDSPSRKTVEEKISYFSSPKKSNDELPFDKAPIASSADKRSRTQKTANLSSFQQKPSDDVFDGVVLDDTTKDETMVLPRVSTPPPEDSPVMRGKDQMNNMADTVEDIQSTENTMEEEKKEEEVFNAPTSVPLSPSAKSVSSVHSGSRLLNLVRSFSPTSRSVHSSASTDDESMYTSNTGNTNEKTIDTSNLSPLSTQIFDKEINPRGAPDIPDDEAKGLVHPNLSSNIGGAFAKNNFYYVAEESAPDDERIMAPGIHYINRNGSDSSKGKYGRSVRSLGSNFVPRSGSGSDRSTDSTGRQSPMASIYGQLATSVGQEPAPKPVFKRRSKRGEDRETVAVSPQPRQEGDTWSNFLQELAEAEKHFFAPSSGGKDESILNIGDSQDSEDSEVAQINDTM